MNYVIYGEERFLLEKRIKSLKKKYDIREEDMNYIVYDANETKMHEILEDAITPPFLTEYKMILVTNPLFLTSTKQKNVDEEDIKQLERYLSQDNPFTILVFYLIGKVDDRKKIVKNMKKHAEIKRIDKLDDHDIYKIAHQSILSRNCKIEDDALNKLLERDSENLMILSNDIEKLCLYTNHITLDDVNHLVTKPIEENVFELTKAILDKNTQRTMSIYQDLKMKNEEPIKLIALIASSLRSLYQVKLLDRKGYNDQEIGSMLSMNPYRLRYIRQDGKKFNIEELLKLMNDLSHLDVDIKTGKIDRFKGLEVFLLKAGEQNGIY